MLLMHVGGATLSLSEMDTVTNKLHRGDVVKQLKAVSEPKKNLSDGRIMIV